MEKLTGETSVHYVELNTFMFYMVYMEGEEQAYIWGCGELRRTAPCFIHRNFIWWVSGLGTHIHGHCFMVFLHKVVKQKKKEYVYCGDSNSLKLVHFIKFGVFGDK